MKRMWWLVAAAGLLTTAAAARAEKVTFGDKFIPGRYRQTMTTVSEQSTMVAEQPITQSMSQEIAADITISAPDAQGLKTVTWRYDRIKLSVKAGGQTVEYDSAADKPAAGPAAVFRALVGTEIVMKVNADDRIIAVAGLDALWEKLAKADPTQSATSQTMKKAMGDRQIAQMVEQTYGQLPGGPVEVGEQWKRTTDVEVPLLGKAATATVCKLSEVRQGPRGRQAVIDYTAQMVGDKPNTTTIPTGQATVSNVKINMSGRQVIDTANPMLCESTIRQVGAMDMAFGAAGAAPMSTRVTFEGNVKVTVVPAPAEAEKAGDK